MSKIFLVDNMEFDLWEDQEIPRPDVIYADCIYQDFNPMWAAKYWEYLRTDGVFIIQTDWHSDSEYDYFMKHTIGATLINKVVWKNEWGNHPKNKFHQCYDTILIYSTHNNWKFNPDVIQVPKATKNTKMNPSGRQTKQATAWIDDICLTTTAKERVHYPDGKCVEWQKPRKLYDRIIAPFVDKYSFVLDIFGGVFTLGRWCKKRDILYFGLENNPTKYELGKENILQGVIND